MAAAEITIPILASWVDEVIASVVRDEGLDMSDPFVAKVVARTRAYLDQAVIRVVIRAPEDGS